MQYANGAATTYDYDPETFRLVRLATARWCRDEGVSAQIFADETRIQDLHYAYDPVGNITEIADHALRTEFHRNHRVDAVCRYAYDPLYRLIAATGRESIGQNAFDFAPHDGDYRDYPFLGAAGLGDPRALQEYAERYDYDPVGNFISLAHRAEHGSWTRRYVYSEESLLEPAKRGNRLSQTHLQGTGERGPERYLYDADGDIVQMPHLPAMCWDFMDRLAASARQVVNDGAAETTFYQYDAAGRRIRKVTERRSGARKNERLYLGGFEVFREYDRDGVVVERETLHVMDDKERIALVETLTRERGHSLRSPEPVQRYQLANHLGSASLELDEAARLISYEEYAPYGETVYQAGRHAGEARLKRYRYIGRERDEENGFYYCSARYQCPWLGRWISPDPKGVEGGLNLYGYARQSPVGRSDPEGRDPLEPPKEDKTAPNQSKDQSKGDKTAPDAAQNKKNADTTTPNVNQKKETLQDQVDNTKEPPEEKKTANEPPQATSYLFTATQSADEETNRKVFEAMITQAVGKGGLGAAQLNAIWRAVWDSKAAGFSLSVQKDTQSKDVGVTVGGIYHAWAKDESKSPVKVGLYILPVATYADVGGKKTTSFGASAVGAASADLSENASLDLNATVTAATSTQLTDNATTLSPYGAFGLSAALTFKPGKGVQIPIEGSVTWASGPQSGGNNTNSTSSTRVNAGVGVGKLGLLGLPFLGVYAGVADESIVPPFTAPSAAQRVTTANFGVVGVF